MRKEITDAVNAQLSREYNPYISDHFLMIPASVMHNIEWGIKFDTVLPECIDE